VASAIASSAAGYAGDLSATLRMLGLAWVVKRSWFQAEQGQRLMLIGSVGLLVALAIGVVPFLRGLKTYLELPSVGHVNQSALFIATLATAALGWCMRLRNWPRWQSAVVAGVALLSGIALLVSASRAALLAYAVFSLGLLGLLFVEGARKPALRRAAAATFALLLIGGAGVVGIAQHFPSLSGSKLLIAGIVNSASVSHRMQHWRLAYEGWRQRPVLGHGPEAFQRIRPEAVCEWKQQRGEACDRSAYDSATHAHSLYVSTLAERGLLGVFALASFLGLWGVELARQAREQLRSPLWIASAAAWGTVVVGGIFNTTMRVEHGALALVMLALWLSAGRRAQGS